MFKAAFVPFSLVMLMSSLGFASQPSASPDRTATQLCDGSSCKCEKCGKEKCECKDCHCGNCPGKRS